MALTLHMPGTLDLIMKGALAGRTFSGSVVLSVMNQLNAIIAIMVNLMIFFMEFPFGIKHELLHPKELECYSVIIILIHLYRTDLYPHLFFVYGKLLAESFADQVL